MKKLILPLLSLLVIGAADYDDCGPTYTVTRTWVEGHYERQGCEERYVPGHWVETRREVPPPQRVVIVHDRDHGWSDDRHEGYHGHEEHEQHGTAVVAPVPVPVPLPLPIPFFPWFGHHH